MKHIELINSVSQTVASGGNIALGVVNFRYCNGAFLYNGSDAITLGAPGVYEVLIKADVTGTVATQTVKYSIVHNGTVSTVSSATAVTADVGDTITLTIPKLIRICSTPITLNLVNSGAADTTYNNIIVDIVKVA